MAILVQDLRLAARQLARVPGFTMLVVLTLAFGIGANIAVFSVVYGVVLRPLPYNEPRQLVRITSELRTFGATGTGVAPLELFDYQARTDLFSGVSGLYPVNANLTGGAAPERVEVLFVSASYFTVLGVAPQLGRVFGAQDDGPGNPPVAIVSDSYWRRRLNADRDAVGRTILLDGDPFTLVGVMPAAFDHPGRTTTTGVDVWSPAGYRAAPFMPPTRHRRYLNGAIARLQPGVSVADAQAALDAYAIQTRQLHPTDYPLADGWQPRIVPLQEDVVENIAATMWILLAGVGLLMLIACVNVANLILTRASERQREIAVRRALGASQARLTRQLLAESFVLAVAGGALGLLVASWGLRSLLSLAPSQLPRTTDVAIDGVAIGVAVGLTLITTIVFGLAPALQLRRSRAFSAMKEHGRGGTAGRERRRVRHGLVSVQVALATVLLIAAGLFTRTVGALLQVPVGFATENLVTARIWLPRPNDPSQGAYFRPESRAAFYRETLRRVNELPGVERAALSTQIPMGGFNAPLFFDVDGRGASAARTTIHSFQVTPGYFETMGIRVVRGRGLTEGDRADSQPVAVISEAAARAFWSGEDPLIQRIRLGPDLPWMPIVGVVSDVQNRRLTEPAQPILYQSLDQSPSLSVALVARTRGPQPGIGEALAGAVRAVDRDVPVHSVRTMDELLSTAVAQRRFLMRVVLAFGGAAIGLALLGLYGVISYSVSRRTREIGIRVAVGARQLDIARLVVRQGLSLAAVGLAIGVATAFGLTQFIQAQLYGVRRFDPLTFGVVFVVVSVAALAAVLLPASRAARIDPIVALRSEG